AREVADALRGMNPADTGPTPARRPPRWSWTIKLSLSLTISFGLLLAVTLLLWQRNATFEDQQALRTAAPPVASAPKGAIDIGVWRTGPDGAAARLRLTDPGALPLKPGDQFRIEATTDRPAYLYLFWIDTEGKTVPVYPWQPGKWGTRPAEEQ